MGSTDTVAPAMTTDEMELKVVFAVDTTGSQQANIDAIRSNLKAIHAQLLQSAASVKVGLVLYKDYKQHDKEDEYVVKTVPFTSDVVAMTAAMDGITACGGGDAPEAVATAMHAVLELDWADAADAADAAGATGNATTTTWVVIWFTDAPPHGLGCYGDAFPNGDPPGHDATAQIAEFARRNIRVNVAACGGLTSTAEVGNAFFRKLAADTAGTFVNMSDAAQLAGVITASTVESVQLNRAASEVRVKLEAMGVHAAEDLEGLDGEQAELVDGLFRSLSASDPVLQRCDAELSAADKNEATTAAAACVADVAAAKTDKEFAAGFGSWRGARGVGGRGVRGGGAPEYRSCGGGGGDGGDGDEGGALAYRSCGGGGGADASYAALTPDKRTREDGEDGEELHVAPLAPRRERTASRLRSIVMGTIPEATRSAP